jgi:hypothetical protein
MSFYRNIGSKVCNGPNRNHSNLKDNLHLFLTLVTFVPGKTWAHVTHINFAQNIEMKRY